MMEDNIKRIARISLVLLLIMSVIQIMPFEEPLIDTVVAGSSWTETTDTDFNKGTLNNLTIEGTGAGALLKLEKYWNISTVDSAGDVGGETSIALDTSNHPHISYHDLTNYDLKYAHWNGSAWNISTVDSAGNVGGYTSIALDASDHPHISYHDWTNDDLKYAHWNG
ncbi:MAG: hypothetical protein KAJ51_14595, partial [Thermoplasmata archaeon]|nr:hypothetical protein [Thermoplasmata archaeon]